MKIYNSMILWIVAVTIFYKLVWGNSRKISGNMKQQDSENVPLFIAVLTFGYIIFWVGIRSGVADTAEYIRMFERTPNSLIEIFNVWNGSEKDPGFDVFNIVFKAMLSENYHHWLMTIAIVTGVTVMLTLKKHSVNFMYSAFLFIVTLNFFWMLNGMRQFVVVAASFFLSDLIKEGKIKKYIAIVLLLSTIHFTALILIPAYWIAREKIFGPKIIFFIILLGIAVIYVEPFVDVMEFFLEDTMYSGYTEQFAYDDGVNPIRVAAMSVAPILAFCARKQLRYYDNSYINICVNMSVISAGIYFWGIFTSGILMGRLPIYFEVYNLILLPYLIEKCFTKNSKVIMYVCCTAGFLGYYYLQMVNSYYISDLTGLVTR